MKEGRKVKYNEGKEERRKSVEGKMRKEEYSVNGGRNEWREERKKKIGGKISEAVRGRKEEEEKEDYLKEKEEEEEKEEKN